MTRLALALALLATTAAADMPVWSGATDRACNGRCQPGIALAAAPISDEWRAEILAMMDQPRRCLTVSDGAILHGTSYWSDGQRYDARLHRVEGEWIACGWWVTEGGVTRGFVELLACENWQLITMWAAAEPLRLSIASAEIPAVDAAGWPLSTLPLGARDWDAPERWTIRTEMTPEPVPAPVPLPAPVWMMLAGLAGLGMLRWRRG